MHPTTISTKLSDIKRNWHLVDLNGKILGRVASQISILLIGKTKPYYVPNLDCGDYVVTINARKIKTTGKKATQKLYLRYSGYPSGLKKKSLSQILAKDPAYIIKEAVSGMLPQNKLRSLMLKRLYIFADEDHPYKNKINRNS